MRKFNTNFACCTNERDYNNLIYGCENRYIPCDIDFKRDIQLDLFRNHMEKYIATDYGIFEKFKYGDYLKDIAQNHFKLILPFFDASGVGTMPFPPFFQIFLIILSKRMTTGRKDTLARQ